MYFVWLKTMKWDWTFSEWSWTQCTERRWTVKAIQIVQWRFWRNITISTKEQSSRCWFIFTVEDAGQFYLLLWCCQGSLWKAGLSRGLLPGKPFVLTSERRDVPVLESEISNVWEVGPESSRWTFLGNHPASWILVSTHWISLKHHKLMNKLCLWNMFTLLNYIKKRSIGHFIIAQL